MTKSLSPSLANVVEAMAGKGLFGLFDRSVAEQILSRGRRFAIAAGEVLFQEGSIGDSAFVLLEGVLEVNVAIGNEQICMAILEPHQLVGEIAVFAGQPRIATVTAREDSTLLALGRKEWLSLVADNPSAGWAIIGDLGRRLSTVNRPLAFLSTASQWLRNEHVDGEALAALAQNVDHLGPFANSFAAMVREIRAKQERQQDMAMARRIQQSVLPGHPPVDPARAAIQAFIRPMKEVGGDLYDFFLVDDRHLAFTIADVSGKGVPASLFMMMFHTVLRAVTTPGMGPAQVLNRANALLAADNDACMFVTAFFALLDLESGEMVYVNAGHNPPYLLGAEDGCRELPSAGAAVGMLEGIAYREQSLTLQPGDLLFLFTDGITEAFAPDRAQYGEARLEALLQAARGASPEALVARVIADVDDFSSGAEQSDDITCLALRFRCAPVRNA